MGDRGTIVSGGSNVAGRNLREFFQPGVSSNGTRIQFVEETGKIITIYTRCVVVNYNWVQCDSKSDLNSRVSTLSYKTLDSIEMNNSSRWGYILLEELELILPISYPDSGLLPECFIFENILCVGICEYIYGYDLKSFEELFMYHSDYMFYTFLDVFDNILTFQHELGFTGLKKNGKVKWNVDVSDIVDDYQINGNYIKGHTISGEAFSINLQCE